MPIDGNVRAPPNGSFVRLFDLCLGCPYFAATLPTQTECLRSPGRTAPSKKNGKKKMAAKKKGDAKGKVSKSKSSKKVKKKTRPKSSSTSIEDLLKLEESIEQRGKAKNRTRAAFEQSKIAVDLAAEALLQGGGAGEGAGKTTANNYN